MTVVFKTASQFADIRIIVNCSFHRKFEVSRTAGLKSCKHLLYKLSRESFLNSFFAKFGFHIDGSKIFRFCNVNEPVNRLSVWGKNSEEREGTKGLFTGYCK